MNLWNECVHHGTHLVDLTLAGMLYGDACLFLGALWGWLSARRRR